MLSFFTDALQGFLGDILLLVNLLRLFSRTKITVNTASVAVGLIGGTAVPFWCPLPGFAAR